jgi:hypothetical protein
LHPTTGQHPKVNTPTDYVCFLGDGEGGFHGYAKALHERSAILQAKLQDVDKKIQPTITEHYKKLANQQSTVLTIHQQSGKLQKSVEQFKQKAEKSAQEAFGLRVRLDRVTARNTENKKKARNLRKQNCDLKKQIMS